MTTVVTESLLGRPVLRTEDDPVLRGETRYTEDFPVEGLLHCVFVRSTVAHATVVGIDVTDARLMPGVVGVFVSEDLDLEPLRMFALAPDTMRRPLLASERVRFVGDLVAVVIAQSRAQAVDAAELVVVDYEPLAAVVDPERAAADGAPVLHPDHGSNVVQTLPYDIVPDVLDEADVVVSGRFVNQRLAAAPLEPNVALAEPDGDTLTLTVTSQNPFSVQRAVCEALGMDADQLRVIAPAVGGGFGAKIGNAPEFVLVAALARRLQRPVRWAEARSESMVAMVHGRAQVQYVELGCRRDGTFTGLRVRVVADVGAYPSQGMYLPNLTRLMCQGVYRIPKVEFTGDVVVTNTTPTGSYRGAGRPEATQLLERIVDMAAVELGIDAVELRRRNLLRPDEFPLTTCTGAAYDSGDYETTLDVALRVADYPALKRDQRERRARGDVRELGVGVCVYVEVTSSSVSREIGTVEIDVDGRIIATVGTSAHGQGHETAFKTLMADRFAVGMADVEVVQSDTARVPRGTGTMASRSLQIGGSAIVTAADEVISAAKQVAAHALGVDEPDVVVRTGGLGVAGAADTALAWEEVARLAADPGRRPEGVDGLRAQATFDQGEATYPFGAHVAVVEVDTETGAVTLLRHVGVDDCGRILNPMLVAGQQHGGFAQGIAQALWEAVVYDEDGNPLTTTFMDYAIPSAAELPSFEASNTETPSPRNPLGAKGIGESGTIGSTSAVHNAVIDALEPYGVRHLDMPLTPERVWDAIRP